MNASQFEKGCIPWNKGLKTGLSFWRGKKRPIETCRKISEGHKGQNINEDRADNRIENLQVMSASEHCSHHKNKEKYNLCLIK